MIPGLLRAPLETRLRGHAFRRGCRGAHGNPCSHELLLALGSRRSFCTWREWHLKEVVRVLQKNYICEFNSIEVI